MSAGRIAEAPAHAWCETMAASGREHLRSLTAAGIKPNGGCDTDTLCGLAAAWDLASPVDAKSLERVKVEGVYSFPCHQCVVRYNEAQP